MEQNEEKKISNLLSMDRKVEAQLPLNESTNLVQLNIIELNKLKN